MDSTEKFLKIENHGHYATHSLSEEVNSGLPSNYPKILILDVRLRRQLLDYSKQKWRKFINIRPISYLEFENNFRNTVYEGLGETPDVA